MQNSLESFLINDRVDENLMKRSSIVLFLSLLLLSTLACNILMPAPLPTATVVPSSIPPTETSAPLISQQVTLVSQSSEETNQTPPFTVEVQTPQLAGSDDPRVTAFNQRLNDLVTKEVEMWRTSFLENTFPTVTNGSFLEVAPTLISQVGDLWSFKFDFHFYSDGAAHPGTYSITLNYDLAQGKELALSELFLPSSNYLESIANYCKAELGKQPFFDGPFSEGANPTPENYRNWNITTNGLMVTFDEYQVAPYAAGPQVVQIPIDQVQSVIDPNGPLKVILP
jgi:hypothetical protein